MANLVYRVSRLVVTAVLLAAFAACDPSGSPTAPDPPTPSGGQTDARQRLPTEPSRTSGPQAGGSDLNYVEVAGRGTVRSMSIANDSSGSVSYLAGDWFEPKDGSYQRMMITETVVATPGEVVTVSTACMQQSKKVPATGARFFSQPKSTAGALQRCQEACLQETGDTQSCIWDCERPSLIWGVTDACNDGRTMRYRFFHIVNGRTVQTWPSSNRVYVASEFDTEYTSTLRPSGGGKVCYGAEAGNNYWGVGIDGDESCERCCYDVPQAGPIEVSTRLTC